ncbi:MAG: hypothetical protein OHK0046_11900 [Anaerolineae bacterium]
MTDDQHNPGRRDEVRRISRKDRKDQIKGRGPLFPPDNPAPPKPQPEETFAFPSQQADLDLDSIVQEVAATLPPLPPEPDKIYTPPAERYPPTSEQIPTLPLEEKQAASRPEVIIPPSRARLYNLITFFFTVATLGLLAYIILLWNDPFSALNPLPPATPFVYVTATFGAPASEAQTVVSTALPPAANGQPFVASGVLYAPNANASGCNWSSIAGTVTGLQGQPLNGYRVQIVDLDDPTRLDVRVFSGSALTFGEGGFELPLGGAPQQGRYSVQLFTAAGAPLSDNYELITQSTCEENVAIVNFVQVAEL